jgi:hypothetical protein
MLLSATEAQPAFFTDRPPLLATPPDPRLRVCVVIPARDEAARIGRTLARLRCQRDDRGAPLDPTRYEVIVLANNCADATADAVRCATCQPGGPPLHLVERELPRPWAHVGGARRLLMDEASRRLRATAGGHGLIATTDADTAVAPNWIAAMLCELEHGAQAIGGRAMLDRAERAALPPAVAQCYLLDLGYRRLVMEYTSYVDPEPWDPWPRHHQHFGASLALTVAAYERAGRLPPLPAREDEALYTALLRVDARFRHSPVVRVVTSARLAGRTSIGLAAQLRDWQRLAEHGLPYAVASAQTVAEELAARAALRRLWRRARLGTPSCCAALHEAAARLAVEPDWLRRALAESPYFGALWAEAQAQRAASGRQPPAVFVDVRGAIAGLRDRLAPLRRRGAADIAPRFCGRYGSPCR